MPQGKAAGVPCVHLSSGMGCVLFYDTRRPDLCNEFKAEYDFCGDNREQALVRLTHLELQSLPDVVVPEGGI